MRATARLHHPDLYLSALLAPRAVRGDLIVLAAYFGEVRRIPLTVREPGLGLIRLQWWRDLIEAENVGGETGAPVADALLRVVRDRRLPLEAVLAPLDAAEVMFSEGPISDERFSALVDGSGATPFRLADYLSNPEHEAVDDDFLNAAGQAYASALLAHDLPHHALVGRWPVPSRFIAGADVPPMSEAVARDVARAAITALLDWGGDRIEEARRHLSEISPAARRSALPAALFEPYSQALQRPGRDPLRDISGLSPLRRVLALWLAHMWARL